MSHQTGIKANEDLRRFFGKCRNGKIRAFKVSILEEQLALSSYKEARGTWEEDFDSCVKHFAILEQPCYILYRLDTKNETGGYSWLLISWSPDESPIRQKMLYASTKATLKQEFGSAQIKEELHATVIGEASLKGLKQQRMADTTPPPLTQREEELSELSTGINTITLSSQSLGSVAMPLGETAATAIRSLNRGQINYVRLKIDIPAERIVLEKSDNIDVAQLGSKVPEDTARYHLFKFGYFHENQPKEAFMFIYSMPGYSCPIKERMLYSSCKGPLLDTLENKFAIRVDKKMEVDSGKELAYDCLYEELHPKMTLPRARFEKPKPAGRGAKRLTKTQQQCSLLH